MSIVILISTPKSIAFPVTTNIVKYLTYLTIQVCGYETEHKFYFNGMEMQ